MTRLEEGIGAGAKAGTVKPDAPRKRQGRVSGAATGGTAQDPAGSGVVVVFGPCAGAAWEAGRGGGSWPQWLPGTPRRLPGVAGFVCFAAGVEATDAASWAAGLYFRLNRLSHRAGWVSSGGLAMGFAAGPWDRKTRHAAIRAWMAARAYPQGALIGTQGGRSEDAWLRYAARRLWHQWPQPAVLVEGDGRIAWANPAARRELRNLREGELGRPWQATMPEGPGGFCLDGQEGQGWRGWALMGQPAASAIPVSGPSRDAGWWVTWRPTVPVPKARRASRILEGIQLAVAFQPIWNLKTGGRLGYEALIRPRRDGQPLSPREWFAWAKQLGEETVADLAALRRVAEEAARCGPWSAACRLFFNLRVGTVADESAWRAVQSLWASFPPQALVLEVGEEGHPELLRVWVRRLAVRDWAIALDDFGVGAEDLYRLLALRPEWIKIDRALVARAPEDPRAESLILGMVRWAHLYDIRVIAEGVQTPEELEAVQAAGVDAGQGFYWGRPGPWPDVAPP